MGENIHRCPSSTLVYLTYGLIKCQNYALLTLATRGLTIREPKDNKHTTRLHRFVKYAYEILILKWSFKSNIVCLQNNFNKQVKKYRALNYYIKILKLENQTSASCISCFTYWKKSSYTFQEGSLKSNIYIFPIFNLCYLLI